MSIAIGRRNTSDPNNQAGIVLKPFIRKPEELRPRNRQRADIIPTDGFSMVVDGKLKTNFDDEQVARAAGVELLAKFPMLRVELYNAKTKVRTKVEA